MKLALELEFPDDQAAAVIGGLKAMAQSGVTCTIRSTNQPADRASAAVVADKHISSLTPLSS